MFEFIKPGTKYDFLGYSRHAILVSIVVIGIGMLSLLLQGMSYGIDFAGGTLVHVRFAGEVPIGDVRESLREVAEGGVTVQDVGGATGEFMIRMPESDPDLKKGLPQKVSALLEQGLGDKAKFEILRVESVGPRVGKDLRRRAILAVLASTAMMGVYVALRFEARFGVGAAVALFHDVLVTVGALSLSRYEFDLNIVAALLTIVGFSVNDTVIISDRVRENMRKSRRESITSLLNRSINETLSRTILTTGTALLVILTLFFFGGELLHGFAFALFVGFVAGTYSTVFIVGPLVVAMDTKRGVRAT